MVRQPTDLVICGTGSSSSTSSSILVSSPAASSFARFSRCSNIRIDTFTNRQLRHPLANLCQISTRVPMCVLGKELQVDLRSDRRFVKCSLEDRHTRKFIRKGNIDELVEMTRAEVS